MILGFSLSLVHLSSQMYLVVLVVLFGRLAFLVVLTSGYVPLGCTSVTSTPSSDPGPVLFVPLTRILVGFNNNITTQLYKG